MRVLHLTTSTLGGAGLAAARLSDEMNLAGIESHIYSRENWNQFNASIFNNRILTIFTKIVTFLSQKNTIKKFTMTTPVSIGVLDRRVVLKLQPEVVHIHNWYNFLSHDDIDWIVKNFPTVFTLHDQRLMSGGCHYSFDCTKFTESCSSCPAVQLGKRLVSSSKEELNRTFANQKNNYALIGPSNWILTEALKTPLGRNAKEICHIPNVMESALTKLDATPRQINHRRVKLLFIAADCNAYSKGLDILLRALPENGKIKNSEVTYELNIIGDSSGVSVKINPNSNYLGKKSPKEIQEYLLSNDILIVPSRYDNSPSVITEGQLSCTVVLASDVGGNPELLNMNPEFIFRLNEGDINKKILDLTTNPILEETLILNRSIALTRSNPAEVIKEHIRLYETMINNDRG
jgi:glycosyltransferase involved in cell wall biosynthesis